MDTDQKKLLDIYLDDHWAAAAAGQALARRMVHNNESTGWGPELERIRRQIESDDQVLTELRGRFGLEGGRLKRTAALAAERVSRFKLNGRLVGYSPLSRVLEAEALLSGIAAKRRLWSALRHGRPVGVDLSGFDLELMERRAEEQLRTIQAFHQDAASVAFGGKPASTL
jgi:hypothetical protein